MKFSLSKSFALGVLLTSAVASSIKIRQDSSLTAILNNLFTTVQTYTGGMNATLATLPNNSSALDTEAALASVGTELTGLASAINGATASIKALKPISQHPGNSTDGHLSQLDLAELEVIATGISLILFEVFATISSAVSLLGLAGLISFLNLLTGGFGLLILAVEVLVDFLLLTVTALLDTLLTGLAIALGGLDL